LRGPKAADTASSLSQDGAGAKPSAARRLEAALEHVPDAVVSPVEALRVEAVQLPHALREVRRGSLQKKVVVVRHQPVRVTEPAVAFDHLAEGLEGRRAVRVIEEDRRPRLRSAWRRRL
jgi:hypothetical protein